MAIQREIWVDYIVEALFGQNGFLNNALNWDEFVRDGKDVHIPQAGDPSDIDINLTTFPASPSERVDGELIFSLDSFYVKPVRVPILDEYELSYNKRESLMGLNLKALADRLAQNVLFRWASAHGKLSNRTTDISAAPIVKTTGEAAPATFERRIGQTVLKATGNRKRARKEDLVDLQLLFDGQDVPADGRFAIIPASMMKGLLLDTDLMKRDNAMEVDPRTGRIVKLYGFNIINRSSVLVANAGNTALIDPQTVRTANQTAINAYNNAAFFWHHHCVGRAQGPTEIFEDDRNPLYYGSLISYFQKFGAAKARLDAIGTATLVEDTAA